MQGALSPRSLASRRRFLGTAGAAGAASLTLSPLAISNCVSGTQVGASTAGAFYGSALDRGGSEFVVYIPEL